MAKITPAVRLFYAEVAIIINKYLQKDPSVVIEVLKRLEAEDAYVQSIVFRETPYESGAASVKITKPNSSIFSL